MKKPLFKRIKVLFFDFFNIPHSELGIRLSKEKERTLMMVDDIEFDFRGWLIKKFQLKETKMVGSFIHGEVWMDFERDGLKLALNYQEPWGWFLISDNKPSDQLLKIIYDRISLDSKKH